MALSTFSPFLPRFRKLLFCLDTVQVYQVGTWDDTLLLIGRPSSSCLKREGKDWNHDK